MLRIKDFKKIKICLVIFIVCSLLFSIGICGISTQASADSNINLDEDIISVKDLSNNVTQYSIEKVTEELFGEVTIHSSEYLYNLDGSQDYIHVEFNDGYIEYKLLASDDDSGAGLNALLNYNFKANTPYILRVKFYNSTTTGFIKLGITPASIIYSNYEKIQTSNEQNASYNLDATLNNTCVLTYTPPTSGTYEFRTNYRGSTKIDTFLFLIDPTTTEIYLYDDDSGGNSQALLTTDLVANRTYFLVISPYNITLSSGPLSLTVSKLS